MTSQPSLAEHSLDAYKALIPLRGDDDAFASAIFETAEIVHDLNGNFDFPFAYVFKDRSAITVTVDQEIALHEEFNVQQYCACDSCRLAA